MKNALGECQSIVLLGGTSDIGLAVVRAALSPATRHVVLACRDTERGDAAALSLSRAGLSVDVGQFDATERGHAASVMQRAAERGDVDLVVVAFADLGDPATTTADIDAAGKVAHLDFTCGVTAVLAAGNVLRRQGHGSIVVLGSVAGERVRAANPVYGGAKAGLDGFCQGYGDLVAAEGVHVLVVRPGFVHSKMTSGLRPAPLSTTPDAVGAAAVAGLRRGRRTAWAPGVLRFVFSLLRHLPGPVWRRLSLG